MNRRRAACLLATLMVTACAPMKADPAAEAVAKTAYGRLTRGEDAALEAMFEPAQRGPQMRGVFEQMRALIPPGPSAAPVLVGWRNLAGTSGVEVTLSHRYDYPDRSVTATTVLTPARKGEWLLRGLHVNVGVASSPSPDVGRPKAAGQAI